MNNGLILCATLLTTACSDNGASLPDAAVDLRPMDTISVDTTDATAHSDLPRDGAPSDLQLADLAKADLPPLPLDAGGKKKLIAWATCSVTTTCKPYCSAIGSKGEGWYDSCTQQLLKDPLSGGMFWDQCSQCTVSCDAIGSYSEGWYAQCP